MAVQLKRKIGATNGIGIGGCERDGLRPRFWFDHGMYETGVGGVQKAGVRCVFAEFPEHEAAKMLRAGKRGLGADRGGIVVSPE